MADSKSKDKSFREDGWETEYDAWTEMHVLSAWVVRETARGMI